MGSEMCIRDSYDDISRSGRRTGPGAEVARVEKSHRYDDDRRRRDNHPTASSLSPGPPTNRLRPLRLHMGD